MPRKNEFVRMIWWKAAPPRLMREDLIELQSELKRLYPTLVMFPKRYHFHELGDEPRRPDFVADLVDHFTNSLQPSSRYKDKHHYRCGYSIALRVPWPEDIATGNPQRLIGRPHRRPFQDSKEVFRRFGRTVYLGGPADLLLFNDVTAELPRHSIAALCNMPVTEIPPGRVLAGLYDRGGMDVQLPYDTEDPEVVAFAKAFASILNKLTVRKFCTYDAVSGDVLFVCSLQPVSKRYMRRCALDPSFHLAFQSIGNNRPYLVGPTPAQRWKWRREAGLPPEPRPASIEASRNLRSGAFAKPYLENHIWPIDIRLEINRAANRALYDKFSAKIEGAVPPYESVLPAIAVTDIWTEQPRRKKPAEETTVSDSGR